MFKTNLQPGEWIKLSKRSQIEKTCVECQTCWCKAVQISITPFDVFGSALIKDVGYFYCGLVARCGYNDSTLRQVRPRSVITELSCGGFRAEYVYFSATFHYFGLLDAIWAKDADSVAVTTSAIANHRLVALRPGSLRDTLSLFCHVNILCECGSRHRTS